MVIFIPINMINDYSFIFTFVALIVNMLTSHLPGFHFILSLRLPLLSGCCPRTPRAPACCTASLCTPRSPIKKRYKWTCFMNIIKNIIVRGGCFQKGFLSTPPIRELGQSNEFVLHDVCVCYRKLMST